MFTICKMVKDIKQHNKEKTNIQVIATPEEHLQYNIRSFNVHNQDFKRGMLVGVMVEKKDDDQKKNEYHVGFVIGINHENTILISSTSKSVFIPIEKILMIEKLEYDLII
jgi:succinyl-CoA synthetase beta subunit